MIEDDASVRTLTARVLEGSNYRVIGVPNAAAAHEALADGLPVHLVPSDVALPGGISGPAFAERARAASSDLKIIFMSGYAAL